MAEQPRRGRETLVVATLALGLLGVAGGAVLLVLRPQEAVAAAAAIALGTLSSALSLSVSFGMETLRALTGGAAGATRYEQLRRWTRLKVGVLFLFLLALLGAVVLIGAFLARAQVVDLTTDSRAVRRSLALLLVALSGAITYAQYQSLRVRLVRDRSGLRRAAHVLGILVAALAAGAAPTLAHRGVLGPFTLSDWPFVALFAFTALAGTMFTGRSVPAPLAVFSQHPEGYQGHTYFSRSKSVVLPTLTAFGLLFVLLLVFLIFGIGVVNRLGQVVQSTMVLIVLAFLGLAVLGSFGAALLLARRQDTPVLYRTERTKQQKTAVLLLGLSLAVAVVLMAVALHLALRGPLLGLEEAAWVDVLAVGLLTAVGPFGFYRAHVARHTRRLEARFPDLLRDLASSHQGGLTMPAAVLVAAKGDYGELTPEVRKMADQISWNVPFEEALSRFGQRVQTPLVERTTGLILEATRTGGHTSDVLTAASRDARELKGLEEQRRLTMGLYTSVIYITFLVFLVVVAILHARFVPEMVRAAEAAANTGATSGGLDFQTITAAEFRTFYYIAALVQGLGDGVLVGMMSSGRPTLGLRHSFIMVAIAFVTFTMLI